ncbi:hypothetical protein T440DRAFT_515547 [Plenodomus tracheiphilus IPT5]|uniref:Uncharacterized protein n=1 Tax=Plenodomus tracheiphilus IPT5 TaxID=1408161 RepID=A0A6A7BD18_9PLEO|nr:hypothetical protein T440DRAFT_515547 [Plenodomus tracheiphilus IPT5]
MPLEEVNEPKRMRGRPRKKQEAGSEEKPKRPVGRPHKGKGAKSKQEDSYLPD